MFQAGLAVDSVVQILKQVRTVLSAGFRGVDEEEFHFRPVQKQNHRQKDGANGETDHHLLQLDGAAGRQG